MYVVHIMNHIHHQMNELFLREKKKEVHSFNDVYGS